MIDLRWSAEEYIHPTDGYKYYRHECEHGVAGIVRRPRDEVRCPNPNCEAPLTYATRKHLMSKKISH